MYFGTHVALRCMALLSPLAQWLTCEHVRNNMYGAGFHTEGHYITHEHSGCIQHQAQYKTDMYKLLDEVEVGMGFIASVCESSG